MLYVWMNVHIYVYMCVYYVIYFTSKIISSNFSTFVISLSKGFTQYNSSPFKYV